MNKVVLFGTEAWAKLCHFYLAHDSSYEVVAFTVDQKYIKEDTFCGLPVVPFEAVENMYPPAEYKMMIAILAKKVNKVRAEKYYQAKTKGYELINYISSKAIVWPDMIVGDNCFIGEGAVCRPFLTIGNDVIIMGGTSLGHDSEIKDHCFIAPRATILGAVTIEPYCIIGGNSIILDGVKVAQECIIGAGSVIHENTKEQQVFRVTPPTLLPLPSDRMGNLIFRRQE